MNLINVGKIVNTHGIKGEIRIVSDFKFKRDVFKINNKLYINNNIYIITSYRKHKIYDMITLEGINNIDDALTIKGNYIYINKNDYMFDGYLNEELIGLDVFDVDKYKGKIIDIYKTKKYDMLVINGNKKHLVPYVEQFINKIDIENGKIYINYIKGLDNED